MEITKSYPKSKNTNQNRIAEILSKNKSPAIYKTHSNNIQYSYYLYHLFFKLRKWKNFIYIFCVICFWENFPIMYDKKMQNKIKIPFGISVNIFEIVLSIFVKIKSLNKSGVLKWNMFASFLVLKICDKFLYVYTIF